MPERTLRRQPERNLNPRCRSGSCELKLKTQHELNLPGQARSCVWRSGIVIVVVEIVGGVDQAKAARWLKDPVVEYRIALTIRCLGVIESQVVGIWIAKLNVIKDVEHLYAKFHRYTLCQFGFLGQCQVNLPDVERANQAVRRVSKSAYKAAGVDAVPAGVSDAGWIERRRGEGSGIDGKCVVLHPSRQKNWNSGNQIGPLSGLIIPIRQLG